MKQPNATGRFPKTKKTLKTQHTPKQTKNKFPSVKHTYVSAQKVQLIVVNLTATWYETPHHTAKYL